MYETSVAQSRMHERRMPLLLVAPSLPSVGAGRCPARLPRLSWKHGTCSMQQKQSDNNISRKDSDSEGKYDNGDNNSGGHDCDGASKLARVSRGLPASLTAFTTCEMYQT